MKSPFVDGKLIKGQLLEMISAGLVRPNTKISWSYSEHDHFSFSKLSFLNVLYKYLGDKLGDVNRIWKETDRKISAPSNVTDIFLQRVFGEDTFYVLEPYFGCSAPGSAIECRDRFSHFMNAFVWVCNTRNALEKGLKTHKALFKTLVRFIFGFT